MGNKAEAKRLMLTADMPCARAARALPGTDATAAGASGPGHPASRCIVKAAAGGGGRAHAAGARCRGACPPR
ncbi:hypothetical protein ACTMU2_20280 [Cupriavidus basilensis]